MKCHHHRRHHHHHRRRRHRRHRHHHHHHRLLRPRWALASSSKCRLCSLSWASARQFPHPNDVYKTKNNLLGKYISKIIGSLLPYLGQFGWDILSRNWQKIHRVYRILQKIPEQTGPL